MLLLVLRGGELRSHPKLQASAVAGLVVFGMISTAYITHASGLVSAREAGVLKRWRAAPLPPWGYFAGRIAATLALAIAAGSATALAGDVLYRLSLGPGAVAGLLVSLACGALAWASIGTAVTALIPTPEAAWPLLGATYLPVVLVSGVFGSVGGDAHWLAELARYLPAQPTVDAVTGALRGHALPLSARDVAVLALWGSAGLIASVRFFPWSPRAGARHNRRRP
jgi:ABC-2 type transport system permease protein